MYMSVKHRFQSDRRKWIPGENDGENGEEAADFFRQLVS